MRRATSLLASITSALALLAALQNACGSSSSKAGPEADAGGHEDATALDGASPPEDGGPDAGADAVGPADGGYAADGTCPAADTFFTANPARAACASAHCCADFTTCLASPECVVLFQCTASCYQGSDASGPAALDPCITQCVGDAATEGANDYRVGVACLRSNCLAEFTDASLD